MKLDIKSFIIGILFTMNIFLIYGFNRIVHDNDHTHDSGDIDHSDYGYGGYGSLKAKIDALEDEIDDRAEESHTHFSFEIY
jgi:hypothetical protein